MTTTYHSVPVYGLRLVKERTERYPTSKVSNENEAAVLLRHLIGDRDVEHFAVILLDGHHNILGTSIVCIGAISSMRLAVRDVIKYPLIRSASGYIVGHNHPSRNITPSEEDLRFTTELMQASKVVGVPLLDHLIVTNGDQSYSFYSHGLLVP